MLGAIAGDIVGSLYERYNIKTTEFPLFVERSRFTDDTVLTVALADSILNGADYTELLKRYGRRYPKAGFGGAFYNWAHSEDRRPYNSWGNGSAMRVSPVGWAYDTLEEVLDRAAQSAEATHNHPEGVKGAQAIAASVFLARTGGTQETIKTFVEETFGYDLSRSLEEIRPEYIFDVSCQGSVPQAIRAFYEATDFEDALRKAISLGGDSDTIASMAGAIAHAFYGVPEPIRTEAYARLDEPLRDVAQAFGARYDCG